MKINMSEWVKNVISDRRKKAMPILSFPCVQLLDISVRELINNSELQAQGIKAVADRTNAAAAVSFMDLSIEAECFGAKIVTFDEEVPSVIGELIKSQEDADNLVIPNVRAARAGLYIDAMSEAVKGINDRPILAGVIGAYSLAGRLVGVSEAMILCYDEPEMLHTVLDKCTQFLINYINEYKKIGANGIVIAEPLTGLLSPSLAEEFSEPYLKRIVDSVQDENFIVVYHNCGNAVVQMINSIVKVGAAAYHFGNAINMRDVMDAIPCDALVMGNIDPAGQFRNGTIESISNQTLELLEELGKYPNFVISSGCDIPPMAQWDNIDAFFNTVDNYYSGK